MGGETRDADARLSSSPASRRHDLPPPPRTPAPAAGIAHHRHSPRLGDAGAAGPPPSRKAAEYGDRLQPCQFALRASPSCFPKGGWNATVGLIAIDVF